MPKLHSFLFVIHKATADTKSQAETWCKKQKLLWYVIALEPYIKKDEKDGFHLHLMFRVPHPRSPTAIVKLFMNLFDRPREDIWSERLQGRFKDQINYVTNEYAGEHADDPKVLDPSPIIWPQGEDPDEVKPKVSIKDQVIHDIQHGATYKYLLKTYPKFVFDNAPKIRKFMEEAREAGLVKYISLPSGAPRPDPPPRDPQAVTTRSSFLDEIFFLT